ncbi:MAG: glycoside hydrolase family 65 protein [Candidatus Omnitrophica bacterium]|nr:glycoside hydrolase family 65 protein [Candidatus Omnitrophota bacterium]
MIKKYLTDSQWLIERKSKNFSSKKQQVDESIFTIGNGYMGLRGILEEAPEGCMPGTFIAGIYDKSVAQVEELINLPNPLDFRVASDGEKLDVKRMQVLKHRRALNMQKGILLRETLFKDAWGRKISYESARFASYDNPHLLVMKVKLKAVGAPVHLMIQECVDDSITNQGGLLEGKKRHVRAIEADIENHFNYLCVRSYTYKTWIAYSSLLSVKKNKKERLSSSRVLSVKLKKNQSITLTKYVTIHTSRHISRKKLKAISSESVKGAYRAGFDKLFLKHSASWSKLWKMSDVVIGGDKDIQRAVRFNIYHLLISAGKWSKDISIAAKTLSGEGYRGHIFWDTEIFILPFFTMTNPQIAKKLLLYRYRRMGEARKRAIATGYKGALFPWESAATGAETTPGYSKDLDGTIIEIHTHNYEHHISSDVAYAVYRYHLLTGDDDFMLRYGMEMIFETARFYASRVSYNREKARYEINHVIGPDEFHIDVNNNTFTNYLAKWNLLYAVTLYDKYRSRSNRRFKSLKTRLKVTDEEVAGWLKITEGICILRSAKKKLIEQFEGYFKKRSITISEWERNFVLASPKTIPLKQIGKTQFVKQADVVMLLFLFPQNFSSDEVKKNYYYYAERTLHKSSLSPSVHAAVAARIGDSLRAYVYFIYSVLADLQNKHGNTADGIHGASLGGSYQAVIKGFGGLRVSEQGISLHPNLPSHWKMLSFKIEHHGRIIAFKISRNKIEITLVDTGQKKRVRKPLTVKVLGRDYNLTAGKVVTVKTGKERGGSYGQS